mmetsp:Transcript_41523/g.102469  ORF Transcript_41523/g.102469 Transcript_41523/m.102469 type:complete len:233 (+) Transcript_41523:243-941(+)
MLLRASAAAHIAAGLHSGGREGRDDEEATRLSDPPARLGPLAGAGARGRGRGDPTGCVSLGLPDSSGTGMSDSSGTGMSDHFGTRMPDYFGTPSAAAAAGSVAAARVAATGADQLRRANCLALPESGSGADKSGRRARMSSAESLVAGLTGRAGGGGGGVGIADSPKYQKLVEELEDESKQLRGARALDVRVTALVGTLQSLAFALFMADMLLTYLAAQCAHLQHACRGPMG